MHLTDSEWQLMKALWQGHPATARDIADRLPPSRPWAYTTIKTMLTRLVKKGAIQEDKRRNTSIYEPILTLNLARRNALTSLLDKAFDGAFGPLMHFLIEEHDLSPRQREELAELLKDKDGGNQS